MESGRIGGASRSAQDRPGVFTVEGDGEELEELLRLDAGRVTSQAGSRTGEFIPHGASIGAPAATGGFDNHGDEVDALLVAVGSGVEMGTLERRVGGGVGGAVRRGQFDEGALQPQE